MSSRSSLNVDNGPSLASVINLYLMMLYVPCIRSRPFVLADLLFGRVITYRYRCGGKYEKKEVGTLPARSLVMKWLIRLPELLSQTRKIGD